MFESVFSQQNLVHKNLTKLPAIFGPGENYLNLVRTELSGAEPDNDSNNFILVNCLLNRSFSKLRLAQFFNRIHQCPDPGDKSRASYLVAEVEKRQQLLDAFEAKSPNLKEEKAFSYVDNCLELLRREALFP
jgi:hypothetical protein